jgi:D-arabinose 5-phosphate isomerase GutQ
MPTASQRFNFVNKYFRSLLGIKKYQQKDAYETAKNSDLWLLVSYGRSERSFETSGGEIARNTDIEIKNFNDVGIRGDTLDVAAPKYEKIYKNPLGIFISATGETPETVDPLDDMASYLEENKNSRWKTLLVTQTPKSKAGKIIEEIGDRGLILEIKGSENLHSMRYSEYGIQRDRAEFANMWFWQGVGKAIVENARHERITEYIEQRLPLIGEKIDEWVEADSETDCFGSCTDNLLSHSNVFVAGRRGGRAVARLLTKRLGQVKQALGDDAYFFGGENTPNPRPGDLAFLISKSGAMKNYYSKKSSKKPTILELAEKSKKAKMTVYSFVGTGGSPLENISDFATVFNSSPQLGCSDTYPSIATLQGVIPIVVAERARIRPEELRKRHGF